MNGTISHIRIDRVAMTGPHKKTVEISFLDGVNIVWGASNAGKSFVRKSIDYVFGGDKVREKIKSDRSDTELERMLAIAEDERDNLQRITVGRQDAIDFLAAQVRADTSALSGEETEIADLSTMIVRFEELNSIFASDLDRLSGLEEGNFLLQKFSEMNCPICGAAPEHQHLHYDFGSIELQRLAAEAEIAKIRREETELANTLTEAKEERRRREIEVEKIRGARTENQRALDEAMGLETSARVTFAKSTERVRELEKEMDDRRLLASYETEIEEVSRQRVASRQRAAGLNLDLTASEANELSKVIKRVLKAWNYPGGEAVHFSTQEQDIVVDGKNRRNNGAGIRAILHAAFKVALLVYCRETGRPHPGFIVLDSPLLAYRPADEKKELGELTEEDFEVQRANLAAHFYEHLHSLQNFAQIIVIENHKSDQAVVAPYPNIQFTRNPSLGRAGFFG